jgi:hypothetical protein
MSNTLVIGSEGFSEAVKIAKNRTYRMFINIFGCDDACFWIYMLTAVPSEQQMPLF